MKNRPGKCTSKVSSTLRRQLGFRLRKAFRLRPLGYAGQDGGQPAALLLLTFNLQPLTCNLSAIGGSASGGQPATDFPMPPWLSNLLSRLLIDRKGERSRAVLAKYRGFFAGFRAYCIGNQGL